MALTRLRPSPAFLKTILAGKETTRMEEFTIEKAKAILEKKLGLKPTYNESVGPYPYGDNLYCRFNVEAGNKSGTYFVIDNGDVIKE